MQLNVEEDWLLKAIAGCFTGHRLNVQENIMKEEKTKKNFVDPPKDISEGIFKDNADSAH